jgi:hypothetical protein
MRSLRDTRFDAGLAAATGSRKTTLVGEHLAHEGDSLRVRLNGLRVDLPESAVVSQAGDAITLAVEADRPGLSPGFFLTGSCTPATPTGPTLRLYAHLDDPDAAAPVWGALVAFLDSLDIGWQAKILSARHLYPRNDAVVVYLRRDGWRHARAIAEMLESGGLLAEGISPFTKRITDSVSCAFEPNDIRPVRKGMSFGQHRADVLAEAMVTFATDEGQGRTLNDVVYTSFVDAGIDPYEPARNLSSPATDVLGLN